ncbi:MAG: S26 family signal peptidase [Aquidulcibacter sp.]|jgi:conjugative transfer signal peptidase TraF|uniref:S26 family signal peptidase n=1 Tax=Aquidulcibacter sp. TaxID=2052990 RepID=UPI0022BE377E|nr:S26 family signal peptidase [Aquidulcibacter sp.]MCE2891758.1 S26 family signal peptidase [Hyphomonadaceae bacterium]MCZ8208698.1 S26 family signal peptidase [Aquidulcibacter sp.]
MKTGILITLVTCNGLLLAQSFMPDQKNAPLAIINETPSMQKGLYVRTGDATDLKRGEIVAMPMPKNAKAYLVEKLGYPADTLLIKRVAALPGDIVCRQKDTLTVVGKTLQAKARDRRGNVLPKWSGCHKLTSEEIFIHGDHPGSFDSRYFGPVSQRALSGTFRQVLSW